MPSALILIAEGTEESEFTITYDILVRGSISVSSAHVGSSSSTSSSSTSPHTVPFVTCSRGVKIVPDLSLTDLAGGKALEYDALVIPGGAKGAELIGANPDVQALISAMYATGKIVAAICAGSLAIKHAGIGKDGAITSHPSVKNSLDKHYTYKEHRVVVADNLITSRGPGTSFEFALAIVEAMVGKHKRHEIEPPLILPSGSVRGIAQSSPDQVSPSS
ncbi:related to Protein DJ-1 [Ustilago trichophora]|uniref:D-lactate dehydratase n=1 Tax=Ustilago trichophora TaxID=86804 RepID=A0A5C3EF18_9BASI|nr:related to Protein DJ-1 [Ustilago trichophora]